MVLHWLIYKSPPRLACLYIEKVGSEKKVLSTDSVDELSEWPHDLQRIKLKKTEEDGKGDNAPVKTETTKTYYDKLKNGKEEAAVRMLRMMPTARITLKI